MTPFGFVLCGEKKSNIFLMKTFSDYSLKFKVTTVYFQYTNTSVHDIFKVLGHIPLPSSSKPTKCFIR